MGKNRKLIVIVGPTASGKTSLAIEKAIKYNTEIFSADSRQLYAELNIGVARPSHVELSTVQHHFIASHSIHQPLDAGSYELEALSALSVFFENNEVAILCGGTGLYVDAVLRGLDVFPPIDKTIIHDLETEFSNHGLVNLNKELQQKDEITYHEIDLNNSRRVIRALSVIRQTNLPFSYFKSRPYKKRNFSTEIIYLTKERIELYDSINQRVDLMLEQGLLDEAKLLYTHRTLKPLQTVGYSEIFDYLENKYSYDEAIEKIKQHSRNYAKRQITYFSKMIEIWGG
jgi:tRNA dimethylallyltransferase